MLLGLSVILASPKEFEIELENQRPPGEEQKEQYNAFIHGNGTPFNIKLL